MNKNYQLINDNQVLFGNIVIEEIKGSVLTGKFFPIYWPEEIKDIFDRYAEDVNKGVFSLLDDIENEILSKKFGILRPNSTLYEPIYDLQIYKSGISFQLINNLAASSEESIPHFLT